MTEGIVINHSRKGFGFIQAEGYPGNVFVSPALMASLSRSLNLDNLVGKEVQFEAEERTKPDDGSKQWHAISICPMTNESREDTLVEEILQALRPAIRMIVRAR